MINIAADIAWSRQEHEAFHDSRYSRGHVWRFDGGAEVPASSSPHIVPLPYSVAASVDPEEAYVAALSSCHMLVFLGLAAKAGFVVNRYEDSAAGIMEKNAEGLLWISRVTLRPRVVYQGPGPTPSDEEALHHRAHQQCFIANSVRTMVETILER
ncbi:OsmC family protein [Bordetella petrii]|uniref:OsmC family protein n=1 Tax=Bordetella petrii TaxID=94624 RepID=UPI001E480F81|nr:OsmC family protein [Bordetella petrii]MCD0503072.1 OsmC family protein [Bordetella petrii]